MKSIAFLVALTLPIVFAAECTDADLASLATSVTACATASGTTLNVSAFDATTAATLCQYSDCQTLLTSVGALTCTESGASLSAAATLCSSTTTTTAPSSGSSTGSTPTTTATSSGSSSGSTPTTTASSGSSSGSTTTTVAPTSSAGSTLLSGMVAMTAVATLI
ncbi:hypothetical protein LEN26_008756 [Aphanomyces euteiches]|nr:hypothetical protein AeMF1_020133 [Aphanomyces euteiches]KAH9130196.1 hypothetical protein LEN26_008756 [Aphanomyces euteiches]